MAQLEQQLQAAVGELQRASEREVTRLEAEKTLVTTQLPVASFLGVETRTPGWHWIVVVKAVGAGCVQGVVSPCVHYERVHGRKTMACSDPTQVTRM